MRDLNPRKRQGSTPGSRAGRWVLLIIVLTAAVPFGAAWWMARHPEWIERTSNYGTLVIPVVTLEADTLTGGLLDPALEPEIRGHWILLQLAGESCDAVCLDSLYMSHQSWLMLNKEMTRVRRLLLTDAESLRSQPLVQADDALAVGRPPAGLRTLLQGLVGSASLEGALFLVDPERNLALWYAPGFDPYRLVKDLKHLLRASQIG